MIATDLFTVDTVTSRRYRVLFFAGLDTRRIHLAGITTNPDGPWTTQAARNLPMNGNHKTRFVIRDRADQFKRSLDNVFTAIGADAIPTPPQAPNTNAFAERWVPHRQKQTPQATQGLPRKLIWNLRQLHRLLNEYLTHLNSHRPHRGIHQQAPNDSKPARPIELTDDTDPTDRTHLGLWRTRQRIPPRPSQPEPTTNNPASPVPPRPDINNNRTTTPTRSRQNRLPAHRRVSGTYGRQLVDGEFEPCRQQPVERCVGTVMWPCSTEATSERSARSASRFVPLNVRLR
ncbi:MAG: hypothetical protein GY925_20535 [Actinomycetia bacterium]|nr:hypothetical protein [Actinomycetes bacterium]